MCEWSDLMQESNDQMLDAVLGKETTLLCKEIGYIVPARQYVVQAWTNGGWICVAPVARMETCKVQRRFLEQADSPLRLRTLFIG